MEGLMTIAKEVSDQNKEHLLKRWNAYCASAKILSLLEEGTIRTLTGMIMNAQIRLYQTEIGRILAKRAIHGELSPPKLKDQVDLVYKFMGMSVTVLMRSYISLGLLVSALENVKTQAKNFKTVYDELQKKEETEFPYMKIMGRGQELRHGEYPDLYFCAMFHYDAIGALGPNGRFTKTDVTTLTSRKLLEKYAKWSAAGTSISEHSINAWREAARELGVEFNENDVTHVAKKLKRAHDDSDG